MLVDEVMVYGRGIVRGPVGGASIYTSLSFVHSFVRYFVLFVTRA